MSSRASQRMIVLCSVSIGLLSELLIDPFTRKSLGTLLPSFALLFLGLFASFSFGISGFSVSVWAICGAVTCASTTFQLIFITRGTLVLPLCAFWVGYMLFFVLLGSIGRKTSEQP